MIAINTNIAALTVYNQSRLNQLEYDEKIERLSSGKRINHGADDPSGLGIAVGMRSQIEGLATATHNIQDGINMLHFLDGVFDVATDISLRMRDLFVRLSNVATLNLNRENPESSDMERIMREVRSLGGLLVKFFKTDPPFPLPPAPPPTALDTRLPFIQYNGKPLLMDGKAIIRDANGVFLGYETHRHLTNPLGEDLQVGPNSGSEFAVNIHVDNIEQKIQAFEQWLDTANAFYEPSRLTATDERWEDFGRVGIDLMDDFITLFSNTRAQIGIQESNLRKTLLDIQAEYINVSAGKSRIMDADMAVEIAAFAKNQIKTQSTTAIASQANAAPLIITKLLGAIYDGLAPPSE
ncbi:MAG: flagellin [bacterium]